MTAEPRLEGCYLDLVGHALINDLHPEMEQRIVALVSELLEARC